MNLKKVKKDLRQALVKKAVGYVAEESVDELIADPNTQEMKIVRRKITKKHIPPDLNAAKLLYEMTGDKTFDFLDMSDEDLLEEQKKLKKLLEDNYVEKS